MLRILSTLFYVLKFPHEGNIITVDQFSFFTSSFKNNVPYVYQFPTPYETIGLDLFKDPALMGAFSFPPPNIAPINMIFVCYDPWVFHAVD